MAATTKRWQIAKWLSSCDNSQYNEELKAYAEGASGGPFDPPRSAGSLAVELGSPSVRLARNCAASEAAC